MTKPSTNKAATTAIHPSIPLSFFILNQRVCLRRRTTRTKSSWRRGILAGALLLRNSQAVSGWAEIPSSALSLVDFYPGKNELAT